jgi:hypothetical protein
MGNRSNATVKRSAKGGADTRKRNLRSKSYKRRPSGISWAERFRRTLGERALRLNELLVQCRQSGIDPEEHPEVVRIRHELASDYDKITDLLANEGEGD